MRVPSPRFVLVAAGFAVTLVGVALAFAAPVLGAVTFSFGTLLVLTAEARLLPEPRLRRALEVAHGGGAVRAGLYAVLVAGLLAVLVTEDSSSLAVVGTGSLLLWVLHLTASWLAADSRASRLETSNVTWRGLDVPGARRETPLAAARQHRLEALFLVALAVTGLTSAALVAGAGRSAALVGTAVALAIATLEVVLAVADRLRSLRDTGLEDSVDRLAEALRERDPEVVFYYSRPEAVGYIANVWTPTLDRLDRQTVVLCREQYNADLVTTERLPVVVVKRAGDLERVVPASVRLAMYPSNVAKNHHLIRVPGIVDVFVGHGDSDKGGSATTLSRIYDEVWVSGPAARDRYREAQVGVRDDQIREIGRPQLAEVARTSPDDPRSHERVTVLYAPTREGFFSAWQYSSVLSQGRGILTTLLADPTVRVLFKPHPGTGTDDPAFRREVTDLLALVHGAGAPHEVVDGTEGLYAAFNRADVLVSDISSVITDFLASGKPYVVTNPSDTHESAFRRQFPSAAGSWILSGDGTDIGAAVRDAAGEDRYAEARAGTAAHLLGPLGGDPVARFDAAVDAAVSATAAKAAAVRRS